MTSPSNPTPFPRRRAPGKYGGKPVKRAFHFVRRDGDKYPSESVAIRSNKEPDDPNKMQSWSWALAYAAANDLWLVVPIRGIDEESVKKDINQARAAIWRTGVTRHGMDLTSEYAYPNLYVKVVQ